MRARGFLLLRRNSSRSAIVNLLHAIRSGGRGDAFPTAAARVGEDSPRKPSAGRVLGSAHLYRNNSVGGGDDPEYHANNRRPPPFTMSNLRVSGGFFFCFYISLPGDRPVVHRNIPINVCPSENGSPPDGKISPRSRHVRFTVRKLQHTTIIVRLFRYLILSTKIYSATLDNTRTNRIAYFI